MPGDPTAIGCAPINVVILIIEDPLKSLLGPEVVAGSRMSNAFGFSGRTAGVQNEQSCFAV